MATLHLILITHTPLHLDRCLAACARQTRPADSITVSCDCLSEEIGHVVRSSALALDTPITLVQRAHTGKARCSQVRNNAVRALLDAGLARESPARLVFLDGDTCPRFDAFELHERLGAPDKLVSAYRINLTSEQTATITPKTIQSHQRPVALLPEQLRELAARHARYLRQSFWRRLGLGKSHKPRLIGGHFSLPLAAYLSVNGCDEEYEGYGQEDDDLTRRLYEAGWKTVVGVKDIEVYHLYHPTRAPGDWHSAPGVARFNTALPIRASRGLESPVSQGPVTVSYFGSSRSAPPTQSADRQPIATRNS